MAELARLEVINRDGWRREYPITKNILHIGSDPHNDIVLEPAYGSGVAPRHLQLIPIPGGQGFRAVNMSGADLTLDDAGQQLVPPHSIVDLVTGQRVKVGEFTVIVHSGDAAFPMSSGGAVREASNGSAPSTNSNRRISHAIGVRVNLPDTVLTPSHPLNGSITIVNAGEQTGVQFNVVIEGLKPEHYEIGPGPILFPGAEKEVVFRISHPREPEPSAGRHEILIHVTAPKAYPGETATVAQALDIRPYYNHRLKLRPIG
ncbi:MAG: FHA domain-containing protein [Anaerolineales bacterium]